MNIALKWVLSMEQSKQPSTVPLSRGRRTRSILTVAYETPFLCVCEHISLFDFFPDRVEEVLAYRIEQILSPFLIALVP